LGTGRYDDWEIRKGIEVAIEAEEEKEEDLEKVED
jgi:hypothetical protein